MDTQTDEEMPYLEDDFEDEHIVLEDREFVPSSSVTVEDVLESDDVAPVGNIGDTGEVREETSGFPSSSEETYSSNSEAHAAASKEEALAKEQQAEIKEEVQKAIDGILKNPSQITNIVNGLKSDKNVLKQVLDFLQKNPQIKKQAMDKAMGSAPTMQQLSRMPKKERDEIMKKAKEARKELAALNPSTNKAILINISRVAKEYPISSEFPSGSKYCDGTVEELKPGLYYVYIPEEKRVNKRATQIVGQTTYGEIVLFRLDANEEIVDFTLSEFNEAFPKLRGPPIVAPPNVKGAKRAKPQSRRR